MTEQSHQTTKENAPKPEAKRQRNYPAMALGAFWLTAAGIAGTGIARDSIRGMRQNTEENRHHEREERALQAQLAETMDEQGVELALGQPVTIPHIELSEDLAEYTRTHENFSPKDQLSILELPSNLTVTRTSHTTFHPFPVGGGLTGIYSTESDQRPGVSIRIALYGNESEAVVPNLRIASTTDLGDSEITLVAATSPGTDRIAYDLNIDSHMTDVPEGNSLIIFNEAPTN